MFFFFGQKIREENSLKLKFFPLKKIYYYSFFLKKKIIIVLIYLQI